MDAAADLAGGPHEVGHGLTAGGGGPWGRVWQVWNVELTFNFVR